MSKTIDTQPKYRDIIKQLDENFKKINAIRPLPASGVAYFINEFAISTTYSNNAIVKATPSLMMKQTFAREGNNLQCTFHAGTR